MGNKPTASLDPAKLLDQVPTPVERLADAVSAVIPAIDRLREAVWPPGKSSFEIDYGMVVLCRRLDELSRRLAELSRALSERADR